MPGISQAILARAVTPLVRTWLRHRGRARSEEKTRRTHREAGGDLRRHKVRQDNGICLRIPSKKHGQACLADSRKVLKAHQQATASGVRAPRHPHRRGGATFPQHASAKQTVVQVATARCNALGRWARRRHPHTGKPWVQDRSCGRLGNPHGRGVGQAKDQEGQTIQTWLGRSSATTSNTKYPKRPGDGHPYAPAGACHRATRAGVKMAKTLQGTRRLMDLGKAQGGLGPVCTQPLTQVTGWPNHHSVYKALGGTDTAEPRVLLPPHGPRQVQAQSLTVSTPRPGKDAPQAQPGALCHA